jgi:hypothetical protein
MLVVAPGVRVGPVCAQIVLREGVRVRIAGEGRRLVGALVQVRPDSVILATEREQRDGLRRSTIHRFDVSRGAKRATMLGATIGLVGLGVGALLYGAAESTGCDPSCTSGQEAAVFALAGAVAGGISGSFFRLERWERVTLPGSSTTPVRGFELGLRLPM